MLPSDAFLSYTRKLERLGLRYMVTGSLAGITYGEPRLTNDVDIILELPREVVGAFRAAFSEQEYYLPPEEIVLQDTHK